MGQFQNTPYALCALTSIEELRLNDLFHTAGEGVNSTIIQCVYEQSLTGIYIFCLFICFQWITYVQIVNLNKKYSELEAHETLK